MLWVRQVTAVAHTSPMAARTTANRPMTREQRCQVPARPREGVIRKSQYNCYIRMKVSCGRAALLPLVSRNRLPSPKAAGTTAKKHNETSHATDQPLTVLTR